MTRLRFFQVNNPGQTPAEIVLSPYPGHGVPEAQLNRCWNA